MTTPLDSPWKDVLEAIKLSEAVANSAGLQNRA
jgi:hypothetical protein